MGMDNSLGMDTAAPTPDHATAGHTATGAAGPTPDPTSAGPDAANPAAAAAAAESADPATAGQAIAGPVSPVDGAPGPRPRLVRSRQDRMIAGVCGGAAQAFGVDATLLRVALVAITVLGFGATALVYLACWMIIPEE